MPDDRSQGVPAPTVPAEASGGSWNWLWWLLALIIVVGLLIWAFSAFTGGTGPVNPPAATATPVAAILNVLSL